MAGAAFLATVLALAMPRLDRPALLRPAALVRALPLRIAPARVATPQAEPALVRLVHRVFDLDALGQVLWFEASAAGSTHGVAEGVRSAMSKWDAWVDTRAPLFQWTACRLAERCRHDFAQLYPYAPPLPLLAPPPPVKPAPRLVAAIAPLTPSLREAFFSSPCLLARLSLRALAWWAIVSCRLLAREAEPRTPSSRAIHLRDLVLHDVALALERHHAAALPERRAMLPVRKRGGGGPFGRGIWGSGTALARLRALRGARGHAQPAQLAPLGWGRRPGPRCAGVVGLGCDAPPHQ
mmetsp:Transcript_33176/g.107290  ORF Transcript_33176/g.107290 Transcript_33176/m.107290 type:complete len:295 (-) Transcript_33176:139-1023(-)